MSLPTAQSCEYHPSASARAPLLPTFIGRRVTPVSPGGVRWRLQTSMTRRRRRRRKRRREGYDDDGSMTTMTTLPSLHTGGRQAPTPSKRNNQHVKPAVAMILRKRDGRGKMTRQRMMDAGRRTATTTTTTQQSNIAREREKKDGGGDRRRAMDDNSDDDNEGQR